MIEALKPLLDTGLLNEETKTAINEAWEAKLDEARTEIRTQIREEFAERYEHDREVMVEALDKMVNETLSTEVSKVVKERKEATAHKIRIVKEMRAVAGKFNTFLTTQLANELKEFRSEEKARKASVKKLEEFVFRALAEELNEFAVDKKDLVETKVKIVSEAKTKLNELKKKFISRSSRAVQEMVSKALKSEMTQLHEDISIARQNNFGRKIFETFASEFATTHLNENKVIRELRNELTESKKQNAKKSQLLESKARSLETLTKRTEREKVLTELLTPLEKNKKEVMSTLLENVQTDKLRNAYDKYLPEVLSRNKSKVQLSENRSEVTGNKAARKANEEDNENIIDIKRLAGLN